MAAVVAVVVVFPSGVLTEQIPVFNLSLLNLYLFECFVLMATPTGLSLSLAPCGPVPVALHGCVVFNKKV